jgi:hypothetical protein
MRERDWKGCHDFLDGALVNADDSQRQSVQRWRVSILESEGRYDEALNHLQAHRTVFNCRTAAHLEIARLYDQMGKPAQAIEELKHAPFGEEMDRHPAFVLDAIYCYCFLLAKTGRPVPPNLLTALPADFMYIQPGGRRTSKDQLISMIDKSGTQGT